MSQYTHIYLREKGRPILHFRQYLSEDEIQGLSKEQIVASYAEVDAYNETVSKSFGCVLLYLDTSPSRELDVLPYSEEPRPLSKELLEDVLSFYEDKIQSLNDKIAKVKSEIDIMEKRILMSDPKLYNKIDRDIKDNKDYIEEEKELLEAYNFFYSKFSFVKAIIDMPDNSEYELIYTKC